MATYDWFKDAHPLSPKRVIKGIKWYLWFTVVMEGEMKFWPFIKYYGRPNASHKAGWY